MQCSYSVLVSEQVSNLLGWKKETEESGASQEYAGEKKGTWLASVAKCFYSCLEFVDRVYAV